MALEIFRLVGSVFVDTDKAEESLKKTDKTAGGLGNTLANGAKTVGKFAVGFAGAASAAGGALMAIAESTREYREEQGKLQAAFQTSGFSAEEATATYQALNGVLGDSGQAVEAANHLAQLTKNEKDLQTWTKICTGVFATFGDSLPIEGLTEAANETAKTGALTGSLADALNWAGVNEEAFQASLDACSSEQERQALITETLNGLYSEAADKYRDVNAEVIAANEAQDKLNSAMAGIGAAVEPFVTAGKVLISEVLVSLTPMLTNLASFVIPLVTGAISTVSGWVSNLSGRLSNSGLTFQNVMTFIQSFFQQTMNVLRAIWVSVGQPTWDFIMLAVNLVKNLFMENMPAIQAFVRQAFDDIKNLWENNLQPALRAIGDFIENVLAPAFKFVFEKVISPVVKVAFEGIKKMWNGTLKPALQGILDFITGVFTGNWRKAWDGVKNILTGIFNGILTGIETMINGAIGALNGLISGLNKVVSLAGAALGLSVKIPSIPKISLPRLEEGGILEKGQVGLLEGNGAEAVVPLHQNKAWISAVARDMDAAMGGSGSQIAALLTDILETVAEIAEMGIYLDGDAMVGRLAKRMDNKLGQLQAKKARA